VYTERGAYDIEHLRDMSLDDGLEYLLHFNGVGLKTASCVMLFSLGKPAFPVDTHILRLSKRLGIIGAKDSSEKTALIYMGHTNPGDRYKFHIDIIHFGRQICHSRKPECAVCGMRRGCLWYRDRS
jgi:endonuclease-3